MSATRRRTVLVLVLCLFCLSCFEPTIRETLWLDFAPNGFVRITAEVELAGAELATEPGVKRRLREAEAALLAGSDPWSERFARLEPAAERFRWEKRLGRLHAAQRSAVLTEPEELGRFFAATDVAATYRLFESAGSAELVLSPGPSSRASRRERRLAELALAKWSQSVARYFESLSALYAHLEAEPGEERAVLGELYEDLLSEEEKAALPEPSAESRALLDQLEEHTTPVLDALTVPEGEEMSLDELSRLVWDPFPADMKLTLPGPALEVEGLVESGDGGFEVPRHSLWAALGRLSGRWVSPDPVRTLLDLSLSTAGQEAPTFPLDTLVAQPRRWSTATELPRPDELRVELLNQLTPAPNYRATWAIQLEAEPPLSWRE